MGHPTAAPAQGHSPGRCAALVLGGAVAFLRHDRDRSFCRISHKDLSVARPDGYPDQESWTRVSGCRLLVEALFLTLMGEGECV